MKISFFGLRGAYDYYQIGGTESYIRRISKELAGEGHDIEYVMFGGEKKTEKNEGINLYYYKTYEDAIKKLEKSSHIVTVYIPPEKRFKYIYFRKKHNHYKKFHVLYFSFPDNIIKRHAMFIDAKLYPYNGSVIATSYTLYNFLNRWLKNVNLLVPPVPDKFFLKPFEKNIDNKITISYIGRLEEEKGIDDVVKLFKKLESNTKFKLIASTYYWKENKTVKEVQDFFSSSNSIEHINMSYNKFNHNIEEELYKLLVRTDILFLPYTKLTSSINLPLLFLEGMASLCAIITKPFGDIPNIYGTSNFIINDKEFNHLDKKLEKLCINLGEEQRRIYTLTKKLKNKTTNITDKFIYLLEEDNS